MAVRTATEFDILACSKDEDNLPVIHRRLSLPSPLAGDKSSKYVVDAILSPHSARVACITDSGLWTVYNFYLRKASSEVIASGRMAMEDLGKETRGVCRWKMEWNDPDNLFIMGNSMLYLVDLNVVSFLLHETDFRAGMPNLCSLPIRTDCFKVSQ